MSRPLNLCSVTCTLFTVYFAKTENYVDYFWFRNEVITCSDFDDATKKALVLLLLGWHFLKQSAAAGWRPTKFSILFAMCPIWTKL